MITCANPTCSNTFPASGRRRFCSDACKQAIYRTRHHSTAAPDPPAGRSRVVYECPACDTRYLDQQRCADCNQFCRRLGTGGPCPHCDEPVTHNDLNN